MTAGNEDCIRLAHSREERQAIYRLRYRVYVEEMGKAPGYADHERRELHDGLDDWAQLYYVEADAGVVATLRFNWGGERPFPEALRGIYRLDRFKEFPRAQISFSSRLMVAPDWRGSTILGALLGRVYADALERGVRFDFCNCTPALVEFYEQIGYRRYAPGFMDEDAGYHVPCVLLTEDREHLKAVHSPLARLARGRAGTAETARWFEARFPAYVGQVSRRLLDRKRFWELLSERLHSSPVEGISLLSGLDEAEARRFLDTATVLRLKAGDVIIRPGDVGDEMFVILSGVAEAFGSVKGQRRSLTLIHPGEVFGEMAFVGKMKRTAEVVAMTDMEVLVITQAYLRRVMRREPQVTAKVLLNLSLVLAQRLQRRTRSWVEALEGTTP